MIFVIVLNLLLFLSEAGRTSSTYGFTDCTDDCKKKQGNKELGCFGCCSSAYIAKRTDVLKACWRAYWAYYNEFTFKLPPSSFFFITQSYELLTFSFRFEHIFSWWNLQLITKCRIRGLNPRLLFNSQPTASRITLEILSRLVTEIKKKTGASEKPTS